MRMPAASGSWFAGRTTRQLGSCATSRARTGAGAATWAIAIAAVAATLASLLPKPVTTGPQDVAPDLRDAIGAQSGFLRDRGGAIGGLFDLRRDPLLQFLAMLCRRLLRRDG